MRAINVLIIVSGSVMCSVIRYSIPTEWQTTAGYILGWICCGLSFFVEVQKEKGTES